MKLTKIEKELLKFTQDSSMGLIRVNDNSPDVATAYKLCGKGLMRENRNSLPFCKNVLYFNLTKEGWDIKI